MPDTLLTCSVCASEDCAPFVAKDNYGFLECGDCGYVFVHPRPTAQELRHVYSATGHATARDIRPDFYPKASSRWRRALLGACKLWPYVWRKRVLDVGCGGGFMAGAFRRVGAREVVGLDLNADAVAYARNRFAKCRFHVGAFDELGDVARDFDFVYSSEVIEHVLDVEAYASFLAGALKDGGHVFLTTPDIASPNVPADVTQWDVFAPPVHIQFFTEATLTRLLGRFGLTPVTRISDPKGAGLKMIFRKTG